MFAEMCVSFEQKQGQFWVGAGAPGVATVNIDNGFGGAPSQAVPLIADAHLLPHLLLQRQTLKTKCHGLGTRDITEPAMTHPHTSKTRRIQMRLDSQQIYRHPLQRRCWRLASCTPPAKLRSKCRRSSSSQQRCLTGCRHTLAAEATLSMGQPSSPVKRAKCCVGMGKLRSLPKQQHGVGALAIDSVIRPPH